MDFVSETATTDFTQEFPFKQLGEKEWETMPSATSQQVPARHHELRKRKPEEPDMIKEGGHLSGYQLLLVFAARTRLNLE